MSLLRPFTVVFTIALSVSGCVCVDPSKLTAFKCDEGRSCAAGLS